MNTDALPNELELRSRIMNKISEYDQKINSMQSTIVQTILRSEIEVLSRISSDIPDLIDYVLTASTIIPSSVPAY